MIRLMDLLLQESAIRKLRVFDFDDTLVRTRSFIGVTNSAGRTKRLTPGEYAVYTPRPGDQFDYSDFQSVQEPEQIRKVTRILKRLIQSQGERTVVILTARGAASPIQDYLHDIGLGRLPVIALGDSNPERKADWIRDQIHKGYNDIYFIDDSEKNTRAVQRLKSEFPHIRLRAQLVRH
jgi:hypothetical protein